MAGALRSHRRESVVSADFWENLSHGEAGARGIPRLAVHPLRNGKPAISGTCPICGGKVFRKSAADHRSPFDGNAGPPPSAGARGMSRAFRAE